MALMAGVAVFLKVFRKQLCLNLTLRIGCHSAFRATFPILGSLSILTKAGHLGGIGPRGSYQSTLSSHLLVSLFEPPQFSYFSTMFESISVSLLEMFVFVSHLF
jgi:hypothetical protein